MSGALGSVDLFPNLETVLEISSAVGPYAFCGHRTNHVQMPVAIRQVLVGNLRCAGDSTGTPDSGLDSQLGSKSILDALDQVSQLSSECVDLVSNPTTGAQCH
jgi:hypothetical protein